MFTDPEEKKELEKLTKEFQDFLVELYHSDRI